MNAYSRDHFDAVEMELAKRSFAQFVQQAWHVVEPSTTLKWGWMLDGLAEHLQAVSEGEIQNLLANVPPGSMKSLMVGVFWPAWEWGPLRKQSMRYLGAAHEQNLAIRDNRRCRDIIKSDWFQARWPVTLRSDQDGKTDFGNDKTGFRNARAFRSMTGARGDRVLLDDPISAANANSDAHLLEAETIFNETLPTRINDPDSSSIVVIMQRLNQRDISGIILDSEYDYEHFCVPMEHELGRQYLPSRIGWRDPRRREGELMMPDRFTRKAVDALKAQLGTYGTAGQLQQRPAPRGGGIIKEKWYQWFTIRPQILWRAVYVDTAQKEGQENDYSVLQCWGMTPTGQIALLDQLRGKWEAPELERNARSFWAKHRNMEGVGPLRWMTVEDKVSGTGLIQALKKPIRGTAERAPQAAIPVKAKQRDKDKVSRAYSAAPQIEAGNLLLPQDEPWINDLIAESNDFPAAKHDDQMDPLFDAVEEMLIKGVGGRPAPTGGPEDGSYGPRVVE